MTQILTQASFLQIWDMQAQLNKMVNRDTVRIGTIKDSYERLVAVRDYCEAYNHEIYEAKNEFFWKWWSKEVKNGSVPRFQIRDMSKLKIELIDAMHFIISALQCFNGNPQFWLDVSSIWNNDKTIIRRGTDEELYFGIHDCLLPELLIETAKFRDFLTIFARLGISDAEILDIYKKKWQVNIDRQNNGYSVTTKTEEDNEKLAKELDTKDIK